VATLPLKTSHNEQCSVIRFFVGKKTRPNGIHSEMHPVYGDKCFTRPTIHVWCKLFACGQESVEEKRPGRCVLSTTDAVTATVVSLIQSDRRVSISVN